LNKGLLTKSLRETWVTTLVVGVGLFLFELLVAVVLPTFEGELSEMFKRLKFVQQVFAALLGTEVDAAVGPETLSALRWVHPFVLALLWGHALILCTRLPAGEIDRGTIDALLSLPNRRITHYTAESIVWIASGVVVIALAALGVTGGTFAGNFEQPVSARVQMIIYLNLLALYLAVGSLAFFASSLSNHRGRAAGVVFGMVAASFVVNTLSTFSETVARFSFLGVLKYYRPIVIMSRQAWPWSDLAVLLTAAVVFWALGAWCFTRRDIRTV
jgi:hypothetical protein